MMVRKMNQKKRNIPKCLINYISNLHKTNLPIGLKAKNSSLKKSRNKSVKVYSI